MSITLLVALAEEFAIEKGCSRRAMTAFHREFSNWICKNLADDKANKVKAIVSKAHFDLPNRKKPDWWRKQIAQIKK